MSKQPHELLDPAPPWVAPPSFEAAEVELERLRAELHDCQVRYCSLVQHAPVILYVAEAVTSRFLVFEGAVEQIFGFRPEDFYMDRGLGPRIVHPDDREMMATAFFQGLADNKTFDFECRVIRADERIVWIHGAAVPVTDENGRLLRHLGVLTDITARKQAVDSLEAAHQAMEQRVSERTAHLDRLNAKLRHEIEVRRRAQRALRASEAQHRTILDHLQNGVIYTDDEGRVRHINGVACRLLGVTRKRTLNGRIADLPTALLPADIAAVLDEVRTAPSAALPTRRHKAHGQEVLFRFAPVREATGASRGIVITLIDLTENVRMQQQLAEAQRIEMVATLAGGIAHDFNNLMTTVLGLASHMRLRGHPAEADRQRLLQIEEAATTAGHLAHQLLMFARCRRFAPQVVSLASIVRQVINGCASMLPHNVDLRYSPPDASWAVECDATHIQQVVESITRNAIEAMPDGGTLTVEVVHRSLREKCDAVRPAIDSGDYACIRIHDTGTGMDEATRRRVFEPFFTTKAKNYGLGLAAAYGIVQGHGGGIEVESQPGAGTTFAVWLPRAQQDTGPVQAH